MKQMIIISICLVLAGCSTTSSRVFTVQRDQEQASWDRARSYVYQVDEGVFQEHETILCGNHYNVIRERDRDQIRYICVYTGVFTNERTSDNQRSADNNLKALENYIRHGNPSDTASISEIPEDQLNKK